MSRDAESRLTGTNTAPRQDRGQTESTSVILRAVCRRCWLPRSMSKRVYLAGPEVILAMSHDIGPHKRAICARHGLIGIYSADEPHAPDPAHSLPEQGIAISQAMERAMRSCDAMIANLTPFRGPSANVGSAYEMEYMRPLGRPIFAYCNDTRSLLDRVTAFRGDAIRRRPRGSTKIATAWRLSHSRRVTTSCSPAPSRRGVWRLPPWRRPSVTPHSLRSSAVLNERRLSWRADRRVAGNQENSARAPTCCQPRRG